MSEDKKEIAVPEKKVLAPIVAGGGIQAIAPRNFEEVQRIAGILLASGTVPYQLTKNKSQQETIAVLSVIIMQGLEVGFGPMLAMKNIAVINNKPCIWGDGAVALLQSRGQLKSYEKEFIGEKPDNNDLKSWDDSYGVRVTLERRGQNTPYVNEFTVGNARRAKLWMNPKKTPWMEYPETMLKWRAFGFSAREGFADCLAGMVIGEEAQDLPKEEADKKVDDSFLSDEPTIEGEATLIEKPKTDDVDNPLDDHYNGG